MPLLDGPSLGGNARHVLRQYAEESALARGRAANAAGTEEFGGGCLRGRYNNLREVIQNNPSLVVVPSIINAGSLFVQRPICRTNYLPNNSMAGATGGVLPTNWSIASLPAGITVSYSASGTAVATDGTSVNYIDVTVSGTAGASGFLNIRPNPSPSTIAAFIGQSWNTSVYLQLISGSVASISPTWQLQELNSSQTFLQGSNIGGLGSLVVGGQFERYNVSRVLTDSATAFVTCRWGHSFVSGTTYSYTLRIGSPQLERFSVPTPMIATSTGAVTRLNESTNVVGLPPDFTVSRNTTATRVNSSGLIESVASGVPRIDWLGQSCPALLVEASGQNLCLQSEAFNVTWGANNSTQVSANTTGTTDPTGGNNADLIFCQASGSAAQGFTQSIIVTASGTYTMSVFVKKAVNFNWFRLQFTDAAGAFGQAYYNIASGTLGTITSGSTATITDFGNGWYRLTHSRLTASGTISIGLRLASADNQPNVNADGNSGTYAWGAQLEVGSIATTYIPTTVAAVSRAADVISASGALVSGLIGQTEGTIYAEVDIRNMAKETYTLEVDDGVNANRIIIRSLTSNQMRGSIVATTSSGTIGISSATFTSGIVKIAFAYKSGDFALSVNGAAALTASGTFTFGASLNRITLGSVGGGGSQLNDRIRAAALYTTRLTDAQLAELTRL